jgi:hypothetical protein
VTRSFTDRYGTGLEVGGEASFAACARVTVSKPCGVHVEASDFPALIAALYAAAGQPGPVILDRPEEPRASLEFEGITWTLRPGDGVEATRAGAIVTTGTLYRPERLRGIAAALACLADEAERDEPDPADVAKLTRVLERSGALSTDTPVEALARAALAWMAGRKQRGEADA